MLEQQGQVVATAGGRAAVRLGGQSGCAACDAGRGCGAGLFGRLLRRRPVVLEFDNHLGARCGQAVLVGVSEQWFLRLVTRFYLVPLLAGLGGAALGHHLAGMLQAGTAGRDLLTLAGALAAGAVALWRNRARPVGYPAALAVHLLRVVDDTQFEHC
jgi:sigma-E factor negative regulatory protein RseC